MAGTMAGAADSFLEQAGFDRAPWLVVALAAGIAAWFALPGPITWTAALTAAGLVAGAAWRGWHGREDRTHLQRAVIALCLLFAFGLALIWARSILVGTPPVERPQFGQVRGRVLARIEQPSQGRVRLVLAARTEDGAARRVRINVPLAADSAALREGAVIALRARLMPPAAPMLPGGYDFARSAWFQGFAATGSAVGDIAVIVPPPHGTDAGLAGLQRRLSGHVRARLGGSAGSIAAAFASGDRGAITPADEAAMRDAGLTHLLSISGLHVSAVIGAAYILALRLLALWPWLALRARLPLVASAIGAGAGVFYTLLTGAEVPTVRSCLGALLVLGALALGREPLSLRLVAVAAFIVLLLWPEALVGPSFQLSFAAVLAIVALSGAAPIRAFLTPREEGPGCRLLRQITMLLLTGVVIELALMPIVLWHFHRAGFYGALANVIAIPLVTFVSMPLIALALILDLAGAGAPAWWLAGRSLDALLGIAHFTAARPGAVTALPAMGGGTFALFVAGGLWLALWRGRPRLAGLVPMAVAVACTWTLRAPDLLVTGDGHQIAVVEDGQLLMLRPTRSTYLRDGMLEAAGLRGDPLPLMEWPGTRCSADFCVTTLRRGGRAWHLLLARSRDRIEERALAAACDRSDIVIAERWLPRSCRPRWLKADRRMLEQTGGLAIDLANRRITGVADGQGAHGWWRPPPPRRLRPRPAVTKQAPSFVGPRTGPIAETMTEQFATTGRDKPHDQHFRRRRELAPMSTDRRADQGARPTTRQLTKPRTNDPVVQVRSRAR